EDAEGNLWIGTNDGLSRWKDGHFQNFTTREGLSVNTVVAIHEDKEKNLWLGTAGGGLNRLSKVQSPKSKAGDPALTFHVSRFTSRNGLFDDDVFEILEDDHGCLWMTCRNGIFQVAKK